jgi:hypothetical protein
MMVQILVVLSPFLAFAYANEPSKVHNKLAQMLDMHFRSLGVMKTLVKWANVIQMVQNVKVFDDPLLNVNFQFQNLAINILTKPTMVDHDDFIFKVVTSSKVVYKGY